MITLGLKMAKDRTIITQAPLRATTVGGGTDLPSFYRKYGPGACVSFAITKYVTVFVSQNFYPDTIRVSYAKIETVKKVDDIQHPTVREALRLLNIEGGVEIFSHSDIPTKGTGLGSSSTFLVALLHALHAWKGEQVSQNELAEEAVKIARWILKEPGGQQDEYAAARGGINLLEFNTNDSVMVQPIIMKGKDRQNFNDYLMLLYTGKQRSASEILKPQGDNVDAHVETYKQMRDLAYDVQKALTEGDMEEVGALLHKNWELKKTLDPQISNSEIDEIYKTALQNGAIGGKLIGAGGGGFLLLVAPPKEHEKLRGIMGKKGLIEQKFSIDYEGSRVIFVGQQKS
jgi:D-glycero-alpha-D-manno-heptose-7-phosphate kinase